MHRRRALLGLSLLVVALSGARAAACSCEKPGPPCVEFGRASAVFVGTVASVREGERKQKPGGEVEFTPRAVKFSVERTFLGVEGAEVEVLTGLGPEDCGYPFTKGVSYLVYAYRGEKGERLYTSACTRTRRAAAAAEDLQFLRGLAAAPGVNVSGRVERRLSYPGDDITRSNVPFEGVLLSVEGAGQTKEARTDAEGRFELAGLRPGELRLKLQLPDELAAYRHERVLRLAAGGCASEYFYVVDNGRINGKVLDAEGNPVAGAGVVTLDTGGGSSTYYAKTDEEGRYSLSRLPPGRYLVGVNIRGLPRSVEPAELPDDYVCPNCRVLVEMLQADEQAGAYPRVFYPGVFQTAKAVALALGPGQALTGVDMRLPPRPAGAVVKGRAVWADGRPAVGAHFEYRDVTYEDLIVHAYGGRTDERGEFSFRAYQGGRYVVAATSEGVVVSGPRRPGPPPRSAPLTLVVTKPEETITLVIK